MGLESQEQEGRGKAPWEESGGGGGACGCWGCHVGAGEEVQGYPPSPAFSGVSWLQGLPAGRKGGAGVGAELGELGTCPCKGQESF